MQSGKEPSPSEEKSEDLQTPTLPTRARVALVAGSASGSAAGAAAGVVSGNVILPPAAALITRAAMNYALNSNLTFFGQLGRRLLIERSANMAFNMVGQFSGYAGGIVGFIGGGVLGYIMTAEAIVFIHAGYSQLRQFNESTANRLLPSRDTHLSRITEEERDGWILVNARPSQVVIEEVQDEEKTESPTMRARK